MKLTNSKLYAFLGGLGIGTGLILSVEYALGDTSNMVGILNILLGIFALFVQKKKVKK